MTGPPNGVRDDWHVYGRYASVHQVHVKDLMDWARGVRCESQSVSSITQGRNGILTAGFGLDHNAHGFGGRPGRRPWIKTEKEKLQSALLNWRSRYVINTCATGRGFFAKFCRGPSFK
jgi:hypothetical protein